MVDERYKEITVRMLLNHTSGIPGTINKDSATAVKNRAFVQEIPNAADTRWLRSADQCLLQRWLHGCPGLG